MKQRHRYRYLAILIATLTLPGGLHAQSIAERWDVVMRFGFIEVADETLKASYYEASDLEQLAAIVIESELPSDAVVKGSQRRDTGTGVIELATVKSSDGPRLLAVSVAPRNGGGALALVHWLDPTAKNATRRVSDYAAELMKSAMSGAKPGESAQVNVPADRPVPVAKIKRLNGPDVETFLFDLDYAYGAGGAAYPVYKPVVLYADGRVCKCLDTPVMNIDLSGTPTAKLGRWRHSASDYELRVGDDKKWQRIKSTAGKPTALPSLRALRGRYQRLSGGGNTALGGDVVTARVRELEFGRDGRFVLGKQSLAASSAGVGGAHANESGRWSLNGHTLTLTFDHGEVLVTTVFYSDKRKPSADFGRYGVLWIGGEAYKRNR